MKRHLLILNLVAGMFAATAYGDEMIYDKSNLAVDFSQASNEEITHAAQVDAQRYWNASREYMVKRNQVSSFSEEHLNIWARWHHIKDVSLYVTEAIKTMQSLWDERQQSEY